jgi:hypothetical protein
MPLGGTRRLFLALLVLAVGATAARAQFVQRSVGGVSIDPHGLLSNLTAQQRAQLQAVRAQALAALPGDLRATAELRKISLRRLEAALAELAADGKSVPDELKYLAGLTRVQFVFVVPDDQDLVLAGPAEPWQIDAQGEVVGAKSGRPVLLLDDLLVALRSAAAVRQTGISCSIDPTPEGLERVRSLARQLTTIGNREETVRRIEGALGPQVITVTGIPAESHYAGVIVAADYKMKRLAMGLDTSPVTGLPSYLDLARAGSAGLKNMLPRWWLAPSLDALHVDPQGLAYELRGSSVKALAEEDLLTAEGLQRGAGGADPATQKWAQAMTERYDELAAKEPVFAQLRNCMDLSVVATLIEKERLLEKARCELPLLTTGEQLKPDFWPAPQEVSSQASLVKKGRNWLIAVSGGVKFQPWTMVERPREDAALAPLPARAADARRWWWN